MTGTFLPSSVFIKPTTIKIVYSRPIKIEFTFFYISLPQNDAIYPIFLLANCK